MDRDAQIDAIEKTFDDVKVNFDEHYSKKGVYPVEVIPILPDSEMWKFPCAQVKRLLHWMLIFCITSMPQASTRWVKSTFSSLFPLSSCQGLR